MELQSTVHAVASRVQSGILTRRDEHAVAAARAATDIDTASSAMLPSRPAAQELTRRFQTFFAGVVAVNSMYLENRTAQAEQRLGEVRTLEAAINSEIAAAKRQAKDERERLGAVAVAFMGATIVMLAVLVLAMVFFVRRKIVVPVRAVAHASQLIGSGHGDLTARIPVGELAEIDAIAQGFNSLMSSLQQQFVEVRDTAESIRGASAEIATGNLDLSSAPSRRRATCRSPQLDVQLTATCANRRPRPAKANQLAATAAEVAERGGGSSRQVVTRWTRSTDSSRRSPTSSA